jgi:hypothetical protein
MIKIDKVGLIQTSLFLATVAGIYEMRSSNIKNEITGYKTQVLEKDSAAYNRALTRAQNKPLQVQQYIWEQAYQNSVQLKGNADRSYFEGAQKVLEMKK